MILFAKLKMEVANVASPPLLGEDATTCPPLSPSLMEIDDPAVDSTVRLLRAFPESETPPLSLQSSRTI